MRYTIYDLTAGSVRRQGLLQAIHFDDELRGHIQAAATGGKGDGQTAVRLAAGLRAIDAPMSVLRVLRIDDFGGRGLAGPEYEANGAFSALIRDTENSEKQDKTAGGSFGLGAKTLWACSNVLTVMFSSLIHGQEHEGVRVVGKADLGFHELVGRADYGYVGAGYFGTPEDNGQCARSVFVDPSSAWLKDALLDRRPPHGEHRRYGTSALIIAFTDPTTDDEDSTAIAHRIARSIAENFWPAMVDGHLVAHVEHFFGDAHEPRLSEKVDPTEYVPSLVDAYRKHKQDKVSAKLDAPGDVVSVPINLVVPATRADQIDPQHGEMTAECRLVIRLAEAGCIDANLIDHVAYARGRAMVTRYQEKRAVAAGARPFHAVLLAGKLAGDSEEESAAEVFLRYSEPPSHDEWKLWPGLKARYAHGAGKKLEDLFDAVGSRLSEFVAASSSANDDGPAILRRLFRIAEPAPPKEGKLKLLNPVVRLDGDDWIVEAMIEVDKLKQNTLEPKLGVARERGSPMWMEWLELTLPDATVDGHRLHVPQGKKSARFEGRARSHVLGLDASKCAVTLAIRIPTTGPST